MEGFVFDLEAHGPFLAIGFAVGLLSFAMLLLALVPVIRRARQASLGRGFVGVAASFAILVVGVLVVHLLFPDALLALLVGELVAFFVSWTVLAAVLMMRR